MKEIKKVLWALVVIGLATAGTSYSQPKIPKEIPPDVPPEVRERIEKLYSEGPVERGHAAYGLGEMGEKAYPAVPFLIEMLGDSEFLVRRKLVSHPLEPGVTTTPGIEAIIALGKIKDARAVEPLIAVLKGGYSTSDGAAEALREITKQNFGEDPVRWQEWWEKNRTR